MIAVINSGAGNIASVERAIVAAGGDDVRRVTTAAEVAQADRIVFPGQGAFRPVMEWLRETGIDYEIKAALSQGRPYLGVCLGMQVLFSGSEEGEPTAGLGVLPGEVRRLRARKLPHVGWNYAPVLLRYECTEHDGAMYYFVHSYGVQFARGLNDRALALYASQGTAMVSEYDGHDFLAGLRWGRHLVTQFHPEKSGKAGAALIGEWMRS